MAAPNSTTTNSSQNVTTVQALRLLAVLKGLSVAAAGDTAFQIIAAGTWVAREIVTANANVTMATATVGVYTAPAQGGTAVLTTAALTGQTTTTFVYDRAATSLTASLTAQTLYANVGTTVATGTVDLYVYGYDLS